MDYKNTNHKHTMDITFPQAFLKYYKLLLLTVCEILKNRKTEVQLHKVQSWFLLAISETDCVQNSRRAATLVSKAIH